MVSQWSVNVTTSADRGGPPFNTLFSTAHGSVVVWLGGSVVARWFPRMLGVAHEIKGSGGFVRPISDVRVS